MARALVTGGAGFIGSHVAERFLSAGYEVTILDNLSSGKRENVPAAADFRELDIRSPEAAALVRDGAFDVIAHLAAQIDVRRSVDEPGFDADVNIRGTLNLVEAVRQSGRRTRFVFASTGGALYGDGAEPPTVETFAKDPEAPYGIAKLATEYYLAYYARVHGIDTVAVRFGNVYGPRQDLHGEAGVVAIFCNRIISGQPLTVFGDGTQTRDYVFVTDVADGIFRAATAALPAPGRVDARAFNIGTAVETSVVEVARMLMEAAGSEAPLSFAPKRAGEIQQSCLNVDKVGRELGWRPSVSIAEGLRRTMAWASGRETATARA
jgi:UDP-glucose 4-epimerase